MGMKNKKRNYEELIPNDFSFAIIKKGGDNVKANIYR